MSICPECVAGKHYNCDGSAWDDELDEVTTCECQSPHPHPQPITCDWCPDPITDEDPGEFCSGRDGLVHPRCHYETGCRRLEE